MARAQQGNRVRRIGWLIPVDENDPRAKSIISAFTQALADLGWTDGRNVRMDLRWAGGESTRIERTHAYAAELVSFKPDVIFAYAAAQLAPLSRETKTIPIIFVGASAPGGQLMRYIRRTNDSLPTGRDATRSHCPQATVAYCPYSGSEA